MSANSKTKCDQLNCRDNWFLGERGGEFDHTAQILLPKAAPIVAGKLLGQDRQDFFPVPGSLAGQHLRMDALADAPEQQGQFRIDRRGDALA